MSNVQPMAPRKAMTRVEQELLKVGGRMLMLERLGGPAAMATLLLIIASWHGHRANVGFTEYAKLWLLDGNAKSTAAEMLLRDMFSLNGPGAA